MSTGIRIERITAGDWDRFRTLRLEMLADTPLAFLETLEHAEKEPESEWRFRALRSTRTGSLGVVAVETASDTWVGTMSAYLDGTGNAMLVSVYVSPAHRGAANGTTDALLDAVEAWAAERISTGRLMLRVHETNARAQAFYRRRGYEATGRTFPYVLDRSQNELEMARRLARP